MKKTNNILSEFANHKSDAVNIECSEFEKLEKDFGDYLKSTAMNQENKTPHNFCETPEEKCTMNYCDENGCQNRERHLVEENKLPTAYDMLKNQLFPSEQARSTIAGKIEEHTRLHTASLREELEKLRAENERLKLNVSEIEMLLNDKDTEIDELQDYASMLRFGNDSITAENQKLREALEWIQNECYRGPASKQSKKVMDILSKAKVALKGVTNE